MKEEKKFGKCTSFQDVIFTTGLAAIDGEWKPPKNKAYRWWMIFRSQAKRHVRQQDINRWNNKITQHISILYERVLIWVIENSIFTHIFHHIKSNIKRDIRLDEIFTEFTAFMSAVMWTKRPHWKYVYHVCWCAAGRSRRKGEASLIDYRAF